jgi:hypothetical protein
MTEKQAYSYTILRYVHDVLSGEAINVGIVLHVPDAGFLKVRTRHTAGRLKSVFPNIDKSAFSEAMKAIERGIATVAKRSRGEPLLALKANALGYAREVLPRDDSSLQWSPIGTGLTASPDKTLERLYYRFVGRYDHKPARRRADSDVWRQVQDKLSERGIDIQFEPKVLIGSQDRLEFKKAWKNGRWHAYEPLSMDLADAENIKDKARLWRGHLSAVSDSSHDDIQLCFITGQPQNLSLMTAYENAKEILRGSSFHPQVIDEREVDELLEDIERKYHGHQKGATR